MQTTTVELAKLIKKCALEIVAAERKGLLSEERRICNETAKGMNLEPFGEVVFLLLSGNWHQSLDWADKQTKD